MALRLVFQTLTHFRDIWASLSLLLLLMRFVAGLTEGQQFLNRLGMSPVYDDIVVPKLGTAFHDVSTIHQLTPKEKNWLSIWRDYASAAYGDVTQGWNCKACLKPILDTTELPVVLKNQDNTCKITLSINRQLQTIVVAFQGTQNVEGLRVDVNAFRVDWPSSGSGEKAPNAHFAGAQVHSGFFHSYKSIKLFPTVLDVYLDRCSDCSLAFVGHSLGGAQATISMADTLERRPELSPFTALYTFNAPRVGDLKFAQAVHDLGPLVIRVVNKKDFITTLPPKSGGFFHVGDEVWIKDDTMSLYCKTTRDEPENPRCSLSWPRDTYLPHIRDHSIAWGEPIGEQSWMSWKVFFSYIWKQVRPVLPGAAKTMMSASH
ncbi:hypothetical protein H4R34_004063 [Dimargaris verticillata]|uniref:Fungal lipase-type domain-containing protein n=1 Tax=Dimargaris verticillata TaxID=2761393 RepID=A0A9W8B0Y3_9FUNG|nr:hypothetical protein H4R34_004063 [Dimargaris verticillata]